MKKRHSSIVVEENDLAEHSSSKKSRTDSTNDEGGKEEAKRDGGGFKGYKSVLSSTENNPYWIQFSASKSVHHGVYKVSFQFHYH